MFLLSANSGSLAAEISTVFSLVNCVCMLIGAEQVVCGVFLELYSL